MSKPKIKIGILKTETETEKIDDQEFYSLKKSTDGLNDLLKEIVENNVFFMFVELLKKISTDYNDKGISFDELNTRYLSYFQKNLKNSNMYCDILSMNLNDIDLKQIKEQHLTGTDGTDDKEKENIESKNDKNDKIDKIDINENKCYARTATNAQCSRKKHKGYDFCGSHIHTQPYGRIDQSSHSIDTQHKKRGRPPMSHPQPIKTPCQTDENTFNIEATIEIIDGIEYVVDNNTNNIYQINQDFNKNNSEINLSMDNLKLVGKKLPNDGITWYSTTDLTYVNQ